MYGDKTVISITCRYDHTNKGELTVREWFNVIKVQNKVDISLDRVSGNLKHCHSLNFHKYCLV